MTDVDRDKLLLCNLSGGEKSLCERLDESKISKSVGSTVIIDTVYKCDTFSSVSLVFTEHKSLLETDRSPGEYCHDFEARFEGLLANLKSLGASAALSQFRTAIFML